MAIPIINKWKDYYPAPDEGMGSSYERLVLNKLLLRLNKERTYKRVLESPSFGFTGISGINLVALAKAGTEVFLEDDNEERLELIRESWLKLCLPLKSRYNKDFQSLEYEDGYFDLCFSFSALWFVPNLRPYLKELARVCHKDILICLPNRSGLGFKGQLREYSPKSYPMLYPKHIDEKSIIYLLKNEGWNLVENGYIDCPPWPDIGMNKEDFAKTKLGIKLDKPKRNKPLSILPYYMGEDKAFEKRLMRLYHFEKLMPDSFKHFWAHHKYFLFRK